MGIHLPVLQTSRVKLSKRRLEAWAKFFYAFSDIALHLNKRILTDDSPYIRDKSILDLQAFPVSPSNQTFQ
jgi:hypothetical protein